MLAPLIQEAIRRKAADRGGKYTYRDIASDIGGGRTFSHIQKIATGVYKRPDPEVIRDLARVLHPYLNEDEALRAAGWATNSNWSPHNQIEQEQFAGFITALWQNSEFQAMVRSTVQQQADHELTRVLQVWANTLLRMERDVAEVRLRAIAQLGGTLNGPHTEQAVHGPDE